MRGIFLLTIVLFSRFHLCPRSLVLMEKISVVG